mmetsp:Transcript_10796/g.21678  ORF Transcript_10796/g.21678 Transcript_10796/m.21678 type:complete len:378 (-) Transcript_10796:1972-3105(-)
MRGGRSIDLVGTGAGERDVGIRLKRHSVQGLASGEDDFLRNYMASVTDSECLGSSYFACDLRSGSLYSLSWFQDGSSFFWKQQSSQFQIDCTLLLVFKPTKEGCHPGELVSSSWIRRDCPLCREMHRDCTCTSPISGKAITHSSWNSFVEFLQSRQTAEVPCTIYSLELSTRRKRLQRDVIHYGPNMNFKLASDRANLFSLLSRVVPRVTKTPMANVLLHWVIEKDSTPGRGEWENDGKEVSSEVVEVVTDAPNFRFICSSVKINQFRGTHVAEILSDLDPSSTATNVCEECGKVFKRKFHLQSHKQAVHQKVKPYECTSCPARFVARSNLQRHARSVHAGERAFRCAQCDFASARKSDLARHGRLVHEKKLHAGGK